MIGDTEIETECVVSDTTQKAEDLLIVMNFVYIDWNLTLVPGSLIRPKFLSSRPICETSL